MKHNPFRNERDRLFALGHARSFLTQAHYVHRHLSNLTERDMQVISGYDIDEKSHVNYFIEIQNMPIKDSIYLHPRQHNLIQRLNNNNIFSYRDLIIKKRQNTTTWPLSLDIHQIYHSFPRWYPKLYDRASRDYSNIQHYDVNISLNLWTKESNVRTAKIRLRLMEDLKYQDPFERISRGSNIPIPCESNPFIKLRQVTSISRLRVIQYKCLLNIYPTGVLLNKWGVIDDDRCRHCNMKETVVHVTFECQIARESFNSLQDIIDSCYAHQGEPGITLDKEHIVTLNNIPADLSTIVILIKANLLRQGENKRAIGRAAMLAIISDQHRLEFGIAYNQNKLPKHNSKWSLLGSDLPAG